MKNIFHTLKKFCAKRKMNMIRSCGQRRISHLCPEDFRRNPKGYMCCLYAANAGRIMHYHNPRDINECLIRLNIDRYMSGNANNLLRGGADKFAVQKMVADLGFPDILIEQYGAYDSFDEIPFDTLPNQFVLKMNNASGRNYICTDKSAMDKGALKKLFDEWMADRHYGFAEGEWHYELIEPKIVVEKYLSNLGESSLIDYKFHCFRGHVHSCLVCYDRVGHSVNYDHYDINWNPTYGTHAWACKGRRLITKPKNYDKMLEIASKLSAEHEHVRVDLYEVDDKILFGELTFTPSANMMLYYKQEMLDELGREYKKWNG